MHTEALAHFKYADKALHDRVPARNAKKSTLSSELLQINYLKNSQQAISVFTKNGSGSNILTNSSASFTVTQSKAV